MAITNEEYRDDLGTLQQAYLRIAAFVYENGPHYINVQLDVYANEEARQRGIKNILETRQHRVAVPPELTFAGLYEALKQLPEYENAQDC
jgi:hypothetical protein